VRKSNVDVLIITYNSKEFIEACIDSLLSSEGTDIRITVVDNASTDGTVEVIEQKYPSVEVVRNVENIGYARAVNKGVKNVKGDFFIIANADVVFHFDAASQMIAYLTTHSDVGVVGVQQVFPDGRWQRSYGDMLGIWSSTKNLAGITSFHNWIRRLTWPRSIDKFPKEVGYIDGAVMAIRKTAYNFVGGFDESFFFYGEETDFCFRLRKSGWKVVFLPLSHIIHIRGGSSTKVDTVTDKYLRLQVNSKLLLVRKHYPQWQVPLYMLIERMHANKLKLIHQVIRWFAPKSKREHLSNRIMTFNQLVKIWGEHPDR